MSSIIKIVGSSVACNTTPSDFDGNRLIRIINTDTNNSLLTQKSNTAVTIGTLIIAADEVIMVEKSNTDTLESNNAVGLTIATPVAYRN